MSILIVFFVIWCWFMGHADMGLAVFLPTEPVTFLIEAFFVALVIFCILLNKHEKGDE